MMVLSNPLPPPELSERVAAFTGKSLTPLPLAWADSTNWLWRTEALSPQLIKLARTMPSCDPFWESIESLFGFDRWRTPQALTRLAGSLPPTLPLSPLPLTFLGRLQGAPLWSLPWRSGGVPASDEAFAAQLGEQVGRLHRAPVPGLGHPLGKTFPLAQWPERAARWLDAHAIHHCHDNVAWPVPSRAVWCLPDLRPDQFLINATGRWWCDWEALVWAPLEFDLCVIELLLQHATQRDAFLRSYRRHLPLTALEAYRPGMRALAIEMQLHGEAGKDWIELHPHWLKD